MRPGLVPIPIGWLLAYALIGPGCWIRLASKPSLRPRVSQLELLYKDFHLSGPMRAFIDDLGAEIRLTWVAIALDNVCDSAANVLAICRLRPVISF